MSAVSTMDRELTKRTVIGAEEGMNREDGKEGQRTIHLDVIVVRRPLPLFINKILIIGKVAVARSCPLELSMCVCVWYRRLWT